MALEIQPVTLREANAFIKAHHRHHPGVRGCLFCVGVNDGLELVGVAVVGRPVSRILQDDWTAEVTRLCVLPEAPMGGPSKLLAACRKAAMAIGYRRLVTYTLPEEGGASLRGAGWALAGAAGGGSWNRAGRPRVDLHPTQQKLRWEAAL